MFKYIAKTFLIAVIAGSLISVQTSVVYAGVNATKSEAVTDDKGVSSSTKKYQFDKISDSDMLASLAMLAGGFIAGRMFMHYSPATMDVYVAAAGGAAYIAGEVYTNFKFKGTIDAMTLEVSKRSDAKINEEQIQRLNDLKKSYEEARDTTKTKKMLQTASAVAFGAAAAMATYMAFMEDSMVTKCRAALAQAESLVTACASTGATTALCLACKPELTAYNLKFNQYILKMGTIAPSLSLEAATKVDEKLLMSPPKSCMVGAPIPASTLITTSCVSTVAVIQKGEVSGSPVKPTSFNPTFSKKFIAMTKHLPFYALLPYKNPNATTLEKIFDMILPSAHAGWLPLLGLGAGTALAMFGMVEVVSVQVDSMMFNPKYRAIAWAALAGVAYMSMNSSDNVIQELDGNIKKIDSILADLNKLTLGAKAQNIAAQAVNTSTIRTKVTDKEDTTSGPQALTPCMTSNNSTNCKPITQQLANAPGFGNLPDSFKSIATQATKLGDNLSGTNGISGAALSSAEALAKNKSAIGSLLKDRQDALTKITNGKAQPRKEGEQFLNRMKASVQKYLRNKGTTATGMMANLGAMPISGSDKALSEPTGDSTKPTVSAVSGEGRAAESEEKKEEEGAGLNLDFSEAPVEGSVGGNSAGAAAPEYDVKTNEIGKENGPSIFEVISSRYLKSGYPKLLDEEPAKN